MMELVGSVIQIYSNVGILINHYIPLMNGVRHHHGVQVNRVRVIHTAVNLARADHTVVNQARVGGPQVVTVSKSLCK